MSPIRTAPRALTVDDDVLRVRYLDDVLALLYPSVGGDGRRVEYLVVPHARRPRLLVPAHDRRLAATAVRRYTEPQTRLARLKRGAVVAALRTGVSAVLLRDRRRVVAGDESIETYLRGALGVDVHLSIHIGPARANRKPILQVLAADGRTVAFAKLGMSPLTCMLVRDETAALTAVAASALRHLRAPRVLHAGRWNGHEVLIQSALPVSNHRAPVTQSRLAGAMREVAASFGTRRGTLAHGAYLARLRARVAGVAAQADGAALSSALERVVEHRGDVDLTYGAWHGDWAPWNMASVADTLLVWDWERFTLDVPFGFDALHHALQREIAVAPRGDATAALGRMLTRADELLLPFGTAGRATVEATALLYLVDLAARYLADRQAESGARLGVLGTWLLPVLIARVAAL